MSAPEGNGLGEAGARPIDPRAVRVTLAPASAHAGLEPMVVEPRPVPLVPIAPPVPGAEASVPGAAAFPAPAHAPGTPPPDVLVDGRPVEAWLAPPGSARTTLHVAADADDGLRPEATATRVILEAAEPRADRPGTLRREVIVAGWRIEVEIGSERRAALQDRARRGREESARGGPTEVHAIIPGRIVSVSVAPGDEVVAGQQLLVVEAMKMQNELRAPRDGTVSRVAVAAGETSEIGDLLLVLE
jgi:biotin carboxyl carrier protein